MVARFFSAARDALCALALLACAWVMGDLP